MLRQLASGERQAQTRPIRLLEYLPNTPVEHNRGRKIRRVFTEEERILQIMVEQLQMQKVQDNQTINEQKLNLSRLKEKLAQAKKDLEKAEKLLKEARKVSNRKKSRSTTSVGVQVALNLRHKPMKKKDVAVQFMVETQSIAVQTAAQVNSIGIQTESSDTIDQSSNIRIDTVNQSSDEPLASPSLVGLNQVQKSKKQVSAKIYKCRFCGYKAVKEGHVKCHESEYCKNNPNRNEKLFRCGICDKSFTSRRLYDHLKGFTTGKHKPRGKHANLSVEDHIVLWNNFKDSSDE